MNSPGVLVRDLGCCDYGASLAAMRAHTEGRTPGVGDELWLVQHPPVFTLGHAARAEHVLDAGDVPVVRSDRGGQVTYHGPGQVVLYALLELAPRGLTVRGLVNALEEVVLRHLGEHGIRGLRRPGAPGVYVGGRKLAALGLRIRRGCSYHGLAVNVDMDLEPFRRIDPCGYPGLEVTQLRDLGVREPPAACAARLAELCLAVLEDPGGPPRGGGAGP